MIVKGRSSRCLFGSLASRHGVTRQRTMGPGSALQLLPSPPPPPAPRYPLRHARSRKSSARWLRRRRTDGRRPARPARRARRRGRAARANRSRGANGSWAQRDSASGFSLRRKSEPSMRYDLVDRLRRQRAVAGIFQCLRKAAAEKAFDAGLAERAQMIGAHRGAHGGAAQIAVLRQGVWLVQRQHHLVGEPERQAARGVDFCRQRGDESESPRRRSDWSAR